MKVINLPQRSDQWLRFRDGKISGSKAKEYKKASPITKDDLLAFAESKGYQKIPKNTTIAKIREMLKPEELDEIDYRVELSDGIYKLIAENIATPIDPNDYNIDGERFSMALRGTIMEEQAREKTAKKLGKKIIEGKLWLDERGVIRFVTRSSVLDKEPVMRLNASNIIKLKNSQLTGLINKVSIKSEVCKVLERQKVYEMENTSETGSSSSNKKNHEWQIAPRGGTYTAWIKLDDPCWEIEPPRLDYSEGSSRFEANIIGLKDQEVPRGIEATGWLLGDTYKIDFVNNSTYNAYISKIELYGRPAKVVDTIIYEAADNSSIKKYGTHSLEISDNNFLGRRKDCEALGRDILQQSSEYNPEIEAIIKPCPALALGDSVAIDYNNLGDYTVTKISQSYGADGDKMTLKLRKASRVKTFVLDISLLDGRDILG